MKFRFRIEIKSRFIKIEIFLFCVIKIFFKLCTFFLLFNYNKSKIFISSKENNSKRVKQINANLR